MGESIAASVSTKEVAPWLRLLEDHGLVERLKTGTRRSQAVFALSQSAFDRMTLLLTDGADAITPA
jgi:DNA-binding PadR family transcriptional regulator